MDFDSTLMDGETIDLIAETCGLGEKVSSITEAAMRGELDFFESLSQRASLLEGMDASVVEEVCATLPWMPGAKALAKALKAEGYKMMVFSGGFRNATKRAVSELGFDADFSNVLHAKEGKLSGLVGGDMMFDISKGDMLLRIQNILGVSKENTMVIGDGANDRSMFKHAGKRVAFCAKPILKEAANIIIDDKNLENVIEYL
jgi:phosphoserine phosphatase